MANPTVIVVTNGSLKLADSQAALATGTAYTCQVTNAAINAAPNLQDVPATFCSGATKVAASSGFTLAVEWLQDWRATGGGGLSGYAYTNDGKSKWFEIKLDAADTTPVATGQITIAAGPFGGPAGSPLPASAEWPCVGKPTITLPTLMAEGTEADAELEDADALELEDADA